MICPLMRGRQYESSGKCLGDACAMADENGKCLIQQALLCYVSAERERVAAQERAAAEEVQAAMNYWKMAKEGGLFNNNPLKSNE
jgi:hypothetical protein